MIDVVIHRWLRVPYPLNVTTRLKTQKPRATVLFIHGIGNSSTSWDDVINALPHDINCISIDLLGFGNSPRPSWAQYDAKTQARSVMTTFLKLRRIGPVIVVGHSLGSLVGIEIAKRYPLLVSSLILCSPPLYQADSLTLRLMPNRDKLRKDVYRLAKKYPQRFVAISAIARKYNLTNKAFNLSRDNVNTYMNALEATIINQNSLEDASRLQQPITIIHGKLDPVVIPRNLKILTKRNPNTQIIDIIAAHEVRGRFIPAILKTIEYYAKK